MGAVDRPLLLITAGPSREHFDDVRFLSNGASGSLGIALAAAAVPRGWEVHLALGPTRVPAPDRVTVHPFVSALDLDRICTELWPRVDTFIATAAVCDYRPAERYAGKRKKGEDDWAPRMVRTPDVLAGRGAEKGDRTLVGFSLEAGAGPEEAVRKLVKKNLDLILWNTPTNLGSSQGRYTWVEAPETGRAPESSGLGGTRIRDLGLLPKETVAGEILDFVGAARTRRRGPLHPDEEE
ncbi:MAG: phosphopantothenoylcysteine decarboxylase [Planctomycetota bacterium]|jgi:phosphopantothenoylcysteine decarboxylase/phosphopantothenate--cysteine ligase